MSDLTNFPLLHFVNSFAVAATTTHTYRYTQYIKDDTERQGLHFIIDQRIQGDNINYNKTKKKSKHAVCHKMIGTVQWTQTHHERLAVFLMNVHSFLMVTRQSDKIDFCGREHIKQSVGHCVGYGSISSCGIFWTIILLVFNTHLFFTQ